jgi:hypothetical protein
MVAVFISDRGLIYGRCHYRGNTVVNLKWCMVYGGHMVEVGQALMSWGLTDKK